MKNPNPIIPPGMNLDKGRGRSNMRIAVVVIVLVHVALFGGILFNACSQKDEEVKKKPPEENKITSTTSPPPIPSPSDTTVNPLPLSDTTAGGGGAIGVDPLTGTAGGIEPLPVAPSDNTLPAVPAGTGGEGATVGVTPPSPGQEYAIMPGDNFTFIAKKFGVSVKAVQDANPAMDPRKLQIGQKINIPAAATTSAEPETNSGSAALTAVDEYVIQRGDNLTKIAKLHGTTIKALREVNGLQTDRILAGQKLKLPEGTLPAAVPTLDKVLPVPPPGTE